MLQNVTTAYNAKNLEEFMPEELNDNKEVAKAEKKLEQVYKINFQEHQN